jgi:hypothetical protein
MKKVFMALTMIALAHYSAEAQKSQNYKVCKYNNGYATCGNEKTATATADDQQQPDANWQESTTKTTKKGQNYKVCKYNSGYATCGTEKKSTTMLAPYTPAPVTTDETVSAPAAPVTQAAATPPTTYTYYDVMVNYFDRPKHHVIIYSDSMNAPYKGEDSRQNDGVAKNEYRNLNYQLATAELPPSSGSFTK